jgi:hypothetical protein
MFFGGTQNLRGLLSAATCFCCLFSLAAGPALAQQLGVAVMAGDNASKTPAVSKPAAENPKPAAESPKPASGKSELEEMSATVKQLEDRIKELESKLARLESISARQGKIEGGEPAGLTTAAAAATGPEIAKAADDPKKDDPKKDERKQEEEKQKENEGILSFFRGTEISGLVDGYYGYNFNHPSGDAQLRNFDTKHHQFALNLLKLTLEKKPDPDSRLGYRMDLAYGPAMEIVHSTEPGGTGIFRNIEQAYVSYLAPVGKGLQFDFGKFVTPMGAEVIESKDNWNYSRSLLFALAIPYYHAGLRATYNFNSKFAASAFLVNGWNNVVDNNHGKTIGLQAVIKPNAKWTITQNYMAGPEQLNNDHDWRHLWDTTVAYTISPAVSVMANYDYGMDRVAGARVHWTGIAGYLHYQANKWLALTPRFEWYNDADGFTTGTRQTVDEFTMTSEQKIAGGLLTRFEYRHDFSDRPFFIRQPFDPLVKAQSTFTLGIMYAFSSKGEH